MRGFVCALSDRRASSGWIRISAGRDIPRRKQSRAALRRLRGSSLLLGALFVLASIRPALADPASDDAATLLAQMSVAVRDIDYQGSFIYEHNGRIDALRLFHAGGRDERERLLSMSGARSEIVRDGNTVTCLQTGSPTLMLPNLARCTCFRWYRMYQEHRSANSIPLSRRKIASPDIARASSRSFRAMRIVTAIGCGWRTRHGCRCVRWWSTPRSMRSNNSCSSRSISARSRRKAILLQSESPAA